MSVTINGTSGVTTPGITNSEGYTGDGLTIAAAIQELKARIEQLETK